MDEPNTSQPVPAQATEQLHTVPKSLVILPTIALVLCWPLGVFAVLNAAAALRAAERREKDAASGAFRKSRRISFIGISVGLLSAWVGLLIIAVSPPSPLLENGLNTSRILPVNRYSSDLAFGDAPTEFVIRLTVDSGTASFEAYGVAGGYPFTNVGQPDQTFSGTLDRTFLVDAARESRFDVNVRADTPGAQLSCELTQGGVIVSRVTGTDSINCEDQSHSESLSGIGIRDDE